MRSPAWVFWVYLITTVPWAGCLAFYGLRSPWFRSPVGRATFTLYAALTVTLAFATVIRLIHPAHWLTVVLALLLLGSVCVAGWWQLINILRYQREARRDRTNA